MDIKSLLFIILLFGSGICHSQNWVLELKPILGSPIASFQRLNAIEYDQNINFSNGNKPSAISFTDNVELRGQYNLELLCTFLKLNENCSFSAGFGVYNGSRSFVKAEFSQSQYNASSVFLDEINLGNATYATSFSIGPVDFNSYLQFTRKLPVILNNKNQLKHSIGLSFGVTKNKKISETILDPDFGLIIYEPYYSHNYFPFLLCRYELEIQSKNNKNIFNVILTYQQGLFKVANLSFIDVFNQGPFYKQTTVSRGSSLGVSIAKPLNVSNKKNTLIK